MIKRKIQPVLEKLFQQYPIVTITGPRQSGKTTLARMMFPDFAYVNLEAPDIRDFAESDPRSFLKQYPAPAIFDEIQNVPELLSYLQVAVDEAGGNGMYILTGSHQLGLQAAISQSLAGRTGLLELLPLSLEELKEAGIKEDRDTLLSKGFMPRLYDKQIEPLTLYRDYFKTYVERDVRQLVNIRNLRQFDTFVKLLAGRIGQIINLNSLSGEVGVSSTTLKEWLSVLETSYIIFRLPPYFQNFGKRLTKSPKLYFTEPGLAAYLLGLKTTEQVARDPLLGNLFENMVVVEALKARYNVGQDSDLYFFRDSQGFEIDLIWSNGRQLTPIEIKSSRTYNSDFAKNMNRFSKLSDDIQPGVVVYSGEIRSSESAVRYMNYMDTASLFV